MQADASPSGWWWNAFDDGHFPPASLQLQPQRLAVMRRDERQSSPHLALIPADCNAHKSTFKTQGGGGGSTSPTSICCPGSTAAHRLSSETEAEAPLEAGVTDTAGAPITPYSWTSEPSTRAGRSTCAAPGPVLRRRRQAAVRGGGRQACNCSIASSTQRARDAVPLQAASSRVHGDGDVATHASCEAVDVSGRSRRA